jgi:DNA (cytosine-5)-methyltransferase 1
MNYRTVPQLRLNMGELLIDSFAGGGGASTGIEMALGRPVDIAINHDPQAISMHTVNHPCTKHYCESVWEVDPREACQGQPVGLAWFSPDCRHFSKAKGGAPVSPRVRGLAWVVLRWAATVKPRVIMLENVEEFTTWGPLISDENGDLRPCPKRKGQTFQSFKNALGRQGYKVEFKTLRACDYGAPTIRKRLFMVARCDGQPILWPKPTHGPGLKKYRTAADIIDWTLPCPSIFGRKKPLAENTLRRIAKGLQRFVIDNPKPFIVNGADPLAISPHVTKFRSGSIGHDIASPLHTVTASSYVQRPGGSAPIGLVSAFLAKHYGGVTGHGVEQAIGTITQQDHHSLVTSHLVKLRNTQFGQAVTDPIPTLTSGGNHVGEVRAFLLKYYGNDRDGMSLDDPLHTISTRDRFGLVTVRGEQYQIVDIGMRMLQPHELFAAQGFPVNYIFNRDASGKPVTKTQQIAKCGNSVCPPVAAALVGVNMAQALRKASAA